MYTDPLKTSLKSFIAWRKARDYRANVKTRARMLAFCGKDWRISSDHKKAYFHEVTDFADPVWTSEENRRATGFYADNFQDSCIRWAVVKIARANRKRNREALYAPITYCDGWEGVTMHLDSAGSLDDAKRWGEHEAEREAEISREADAEFQAEQKIEDAKNEIHNLCLDTKRIIEGLRASTLHPTICENIRAYINDNRRELHEKLRIIANLRDNFWQAVL